jgi:hypothetical protein
VSKYISDEAKPQLDKLWVRDSLHWSFSPGDKEKGDLPIWSKRCALFEAHLSYQGRTEELGANTAADYYDIAILIGKEYGSESLYTSRSFSASSAEVAKKRADEVVEEFIMAAIRNWLGFDFKLTKPADEVRFKQLTSGVDGKVFGLDEEGKVHQLAGNSWRALSMNKAEDDISKRAAKNAENL